MDFAKAIKDEIIEASDVCYTCWEVEDGPETCNYSTGIAP